MPFDVFRLREHVVQEYRDYVESFVHVLDPRIKPVRALPIEGLMCVPPLDEEPALYFALLREIARRTGLGVLSMGMSADFEKAIRFGATHVRVGTAIFGARGTSE